jgi:lysophospholipase L1-like esterase
MSRRLALLIVLAWTAFAAGPRLDAQPAQPPSGRWITAWSTSHQALGMASVSNATIRLIARVTISGDAVRIRLANTFGASPLRVGKAYVGIRTQGANVATGSNHPLLFGGADTVTIPPGETVISDQVAMSVIPGQDLAVSLYVPDAGVRPSQHSGALTTSYRTPDNAGDAAAQEARTAFTATTTSWYWLKAIDVRSSSHRGAVVAFGDSITDGSCSTVDAHDRWVDWLAIRLALEDDRRGGRRQFSAVLNEGIGGNTITRENLQPPPDSPPGMERLDRDVLSHQGATDVILFMGTNDIRRGAGAAQVIAGMTDIARRLKARALRVHGVTIIPRHNNTGPTGWDPAKTAIRNEVNRWIREKGPFDAVIDFDKAVRDPADPERIRAAFNCDDIHPTPRGYYEMGKSIPLELFQR